MQHMKTFLSPFIIVYCALTSTIAVPSCDWLLVSNPQTPTAYGNYYDITKVMSKELLSSADVVSFDGKESPSARHTYCHLLRRVQETIREKGQGISERGPPSNVLRIGERSRYR